MKVTLPLPIRTLVNVCRFAFAFLLAAATLALFLDSPYLGTWLLALAGVMGGAASGIVIGYELAPDGDKP